MFSTGTLTVQWILATQGLKKYSLEFQQNLNYKWRNILMLWIQLVLSQRTKHSTGVGPCQAFVVELASIRADSSLN